MKRNLRTPKAGCPFNYAWILSGHRAGISGYIRLYGKCSRKDTAIIACDNGKGEMVPLLREGLFASAGKGKSAPSDGVIRRRMENPAWCKAKYAYGSPALFLREKRKVGRLDKWFHKTESGVRSVSIHHLWRIVGMSQLRLIPQVSGCRSQETA